MDKFCPGCQKDHPIDDFALTNGKPRKNCKAFLRSKENANKAAPAIRETWMNDQINNRWLR